MTIFMRRLLSVVILASALLPAFLATSGATVAQSGLDGSACWPQGSLTGVSGGEMTWSQPPATIIDPTQSYQATLDTTLGQILIQLDAASAPIATNNFVCLALAGYYTGTDFHRIFADYLIQGGDPSGTGRGNPGYSVPSDPTLGPYPAGSVSMANAAPNQNGAQFFIAAADLTSAIPADYPVFGHVVGGMDVVQAISQGPVQAQSDGEQSNPVDPTMVISVSISGSGQSTGVGPVVTMPTQTPMAPAQPTETPPPTVAPTQATSAGDAQGRPGGSTASTTGIDPATSGATGCTGFPEYQAAFDDAYTTAAVANPVALAFLFEAQSNPEIDNIFEAMTQEEATAVSEFYLSLADALATIAPPSFVAEWHGIQIEIFRALGEFTGNIASQGLTIASMQAAPVMNDLSSRSDVAMREANAICGEFEAWAMGSEEDA